MDIQFITLNVTPVLTMFETWLRLILNGMDNVFKWEVFFSCLFFINYLPEKMICMERKLFFLFLENGEYFFHLFRFCINRWIFITEFNEQFHDKRASRGKDK